MIGIKLNNRNVKNFEKFEEEVEKEKENNDGNFKRLGSQSTLRSSSSKTMHKSIWSINNNKNVILKMNEIRRNSTDIGMRGMELIMCGIRITFMFFGE